MVVSRRKKKKTKLEKQLDEQIKTVIRRRRMQKGGDAAYDAVVTGMNDATAIMNKLRIPAGDIPSAGTSGSFSTLANDVVGLVENTLNTIIDTVDFADSIIALPANLGTAYNEPLAQQTLTF